MFQSMINTFSRTFQMIKESSIVLRKDKEILLFPFLSLFCGTTLLTIAGAFLFYDPLFEIISSNQISWFGTFILIYIGITFSSTFFHVGLLACANIRLNGGDPRFIDGIEIARKNIKKIFVWSLITASIGMIVRVIGAKFGHVGELASYGALFAWNVTSFLALPVMIFEKKGIKESLFRSARLLKDTWGENITSQFAFSAILYLILFLPGLFFALTWARPFGPEVIQTVLAVNVIIVIGIAIVITSIEGIFKAALYQYATTGKIPSAYSAGTIENSFKKD